MASLTSMESLPLLQHFFLPVLAHDGTPANFVEQMAWHETKIYNLLKAGKRTISIQPWNVFLRLADTEDFRYEVVFGDPEEVMGHRC